MSENNNELLAIDHFVSAKEVGNRILKVLHDIPIEKLRIGGYFRSEIENEILKYNRELWQKGLLNKTEEPVSVHSINRQLDALENAGQIDVTVHEIDSKPRYKLSTSALFYVHSLHSPERYRPSRRRGPLRQTLFGSLNTEGDKIIDVVIMAPGSLILCGEHSALLGQPAVVLPIPLFLVLHATLSKCAVTKVNLRAADPNPWTCYRELCGFPAELKFLEKMEGTLRHKLNQIVDRFTKKVETYARVSGDKSGYYINLQIQSQLPSCCGLGSSGALSAALARLLDLIIYREEEDYSKDLAVKGLDIGSDSRLTELFLNAVEFETIIQGKSSGVGPFASMFGSECFTPIWYDPGARPKRKRGFLMEELLEQRKEGLNVKLDLKCENGSEKARSYLSRDIAVAAIYTTQSRQPLQVTLGDSSYSDRLFRRDCRRDFFGVTKKLWKNLSKGRKNAACQDDIEDVITSINLFGEYEEGYLKMLRSENETVSRDLVYRMRGIGLGAKYTGAGFGGDVVVIGTKKKVSDILIPNYFPVHFTSIDLPSKSPVASGEASLKVVSSKDFAEIFMPRFLSWADIGWP